MMTSLLCTSAATVGLDDEVVVQDVVGVVVVKVFVQSGHDVGVHVEPRPWMTKRNKRKHKRVRKTQQHNRTAGRLVFCFVVVPGAGQQVEQEQREEENCSCGTTMFGSLFVIASLCMAGQLWSGGVRWGHTAPPRGVQLT